MRSSSSRATWREIVRGVAGTPPREVRVLRTADGLVAFVTLGFEPESTLAAAHTRASEVEERLRAEHPEIADVIVHTEPERPAEPDVAA